MTHLTQTHANHLAYLSAQPAIPAASVLALRVAVVLSVWAIRRRTRLALRNLGTRELRDVGLTQAEAFRESRRVFWRA